MTMTDQRLMDLDLLTEGVFGGPLPSAAGLAAVVGTAERLVAVQATSLPKAPPRSRWLCIHPGIGYLLWQGVSPLSRLALPPGMIIGQSQSLSLGLVTAIQQALVSLRRRELAALLRQHAAPPSFERECEARGLLVGQLRAGADWSAAWAWWSGLVLVRHQNQINAVRRKLVELLALVTRDIDRDNELSWPFRACIDTIYGHYALTPLMTEAEQRLRTLSPLLHKRRPQTIPEPLERALAWAVKHLAEPISLRHAAHQAGISSEHLARLARRYLGVTFLAHLTQVRLGEARRLLVESEASVQSIGERCGFGSVEHFQRVFKRGVGTSPGAWRKELSLKPGSGNKGT